MVLVLARAGSVSLSSHHVDIPREKRIEEKGESSLKGHPGDRFRRKKEIVLRIELRGGSVGGVQSLLRPDGR